MNLTLSPMLRVRGFSADDVIVRDVQSPASAISKVDPYSDQAPLGPGHFRGFQAPSGRFVNADQQVRNLFEFCRYRFYVKPARGTNQPLSVVTQNVWVQSGCDQTRQMGSCRAQINGGPFWWVDVILTFDAKSLESHQLVCWGFGKASDSKSRSVPTF